MAARVLFDERDKNPDFTDFQQQFFENFEPMTWCLQETSRCRTAQVVRQLWLTKVAASRGAKLAGEFGTTSAGNFRRVSPIQ